MCKSEDYLLALLSILHCHLFDMQHDYFHELKPLLNRVCVRQNILMPVITQLLQYKFILDLMLFSHSYQ